MRKYWVVAKSTWQVFLAHRLNMVLEVLGNLLTMGVAIGLWVALYQRTGQEKISGFTESEMIRYLLISGFLTATLWFTAQGDHVMSDIHEGNLSKFLVKPLRYPFYNFVKVMTGKVFNFLCILLVIIPVLYFYPDLLRSFNLVSVSLFLLFFMFAIIFQYLLFFSTALMAFWMEEAWGLTFVLRVIADVAAGAFLPLAFFAPFWGNIFNFLPFKYLVSVPVNILLGKIPLSNILYTFGGALVWLMILLFLTSFIMRRGLRRYSAVGA